MKFILSYGNLHCKGDPYQYSVVRDIFTQMQILFLFGTVSGYDCTSIISLISFFTLSLKRNKKVKDEQYNKKNKDKYVHK